MGLAVSSSCCLYSSFLLTLFPCSSMESLQRRQSSTNFSNVGPSHGLLLFMNSSDMGHFHEVQSFRRRLLQRGPPSMGHRSCQKTCSSVGSPQCHSLLLCTSTCSDMGSSMGCRWISGSLWTLMGCRGTTCLTVVFSRVCRRISAQVPGEPPTPPSLLTLVSAELFLSRVLTPLF